MNIICVQTGDLFVNTYICHAEEKKETIIIDPGGSYQKIVNVLDEYGLVPQAVLLTHGHFDHIGALAQIRQAYDVTVYMHTADADMLTDSQRNLSAYLYGKMITCAPTDKTLEDGQTLSVCGLDFTVLHTPGHSPGSVIYLADKVAFTGDTLFKRAIGRTDFLGCSPKAMKASLVKIKQQIPSGVHLFPGHGEDSIMADELKENIYLNQE